MRRVQTSQSGRIDMPALGLSLLLLAVGAILAFAVGGAYAGISLYTVGIILLIVGGIGIVMSMLFLTSWAPFGSRDVR
jgi:hypothetical protein